MQRYIEPESIDENVFTFFFKMFPGFPKMVVEKYLEIGKKQGELEKMGKRSR